MACLRSHSRAAKHIELVFLDHSMTALSTCPKKPVYFDKQTWIQEESKYGLLLFEGAEDSMTDCPDYGDG